MAVWCFSEGVEVMVQYGAVVCPLLALAWDPRMSLKSALEFQRYWLNTWLHRVLFTCPDFLRLMSVTPVSIFLSGIN